MKEHLPYVLPQNSQSQLQFLAKVTNISSNLISNCSEIEVEAIAAMILYRHLNRQQRLEAMALIRSVQNRALMGVLISKVLDTTFVNPQWGIWSLSNSELSQDISFHENIDSFSGYVGVGASILGGKDMIKDIWSLKKMGKKNWITIVIWGCIYFNKTELSKAKSELNNRTQLNNSGFYK
ncbi:hypothetical protein NMR73_004335 [Vibrio navarrensis]|nr:hypothetical protein [Vibrio navarrensis]EJL6568440.1 hypothetical protein [Vibrio navarrensis]